MLDESRPLAALAGYILDSFAYAVDCCIFSGQLQRQRKTGFMTLLDVAYRYVSPPDQATMRALDNVREVYGVRRITFDESVRVIRVEFDASRFKEPVMADLLRRTGLDLGERLILA
jgi:hypothetical protein